MVSVKHIRQSKSILLPFLLEDGGSKSTFPSLTLFLCFLVVTTGKRSWEGWDSSPIPLSDLALFYSEIIITLLDLLSILWDKSLIQSGTCAYFPWDNSISTWFHVLHHFLFKIARFDFCLFIPCTECLVIKGPFCHNIWFYNAYKVKWYWVLAAQFIHKLSQFIHKFSNLNKKWFEEKVLMGPFDK